jgi:hypothetical protein
VVANVVAVFGERLFPASKQLNTLERMFYKFLLGSA